jgi:hypothetical protein
VRRRSLDGAVRWQASDPSLHLDRIVATGGRIYAAGDRSDGDVGAAIVAPVLRAFDGAGTLQWSQRLPAGSSIAGVMGLAAGPDGSALALVGPPLGDANGARFGLLPIDRAGTQGASFAIDLEGYARGGQSGWLGVADGAALVAISRNPGLLQEPARSLDWLGRPRHCFGGDHADLRLIDLAGLQERRRARIDRFRVEAALALAGGWLLVGDERDECGVQYNAAVWRLGADGTTRRLWRDGSPFDTYGRGVRRVASASEGGSKVGSEDGFEVVGYARRAIAVDQDHPRAARLDLLASRRQGDEAYVSGEAFAVRLSESGAEERRDFVGAGLPVVPMGLAASGEHAVVFGSVGGRQLWLER